MQLLFGLDFGFGAHPVDGVDVLAHGRFDVVDFAEGGRFHIGSKVLGDVKLAEGFAEGAIGGLDATLPASLLLGRAGELAAVEVEVLLVKGVREAHGKGVSEMGAEISLNGGQIGIGDGFVERGEKVGRDDVQLLDGGGAHHLDIFRCVDGGRGGREAGEGHHVVDFGGIAAFDVALGGFGEGGFEVQDLLGFRLRGVGCIAE